MFSKLGEAIIDATNKTKDKVQTARKENVLIRTKEDRIKFLEARILEVQAEKAQLEKKLKPLEEGVIWAGKRIKVLEKEQEQKKLQSMDQVMTTYGNFTIVRRKGELEVIFGRMADTSLPSETFYDKITLRELYEKWIRNEI